MDDYSLLRPLPVYCLLPSTACALVMAIYARRGSDKLVQGNKGTHETLFRIVLYKWLFTLGTLRSYPLTILTLTMLDSSYLSFDPSEAVVIWQCSSCRLFKGQISFSFASTKKTRLYIYIHLLPRLLFMNSLVSLSISTSSLRFAESTFWIFTAACQVRNSYEAQYSNHVD